MTDDDRPTPPAPHLVPIIGEIGEGGVVTFYPGPYATVLGPDPERPKPPADAPNVFWLRR